MNQSRDNKHLTVFASQGFSTGTCYFETRVESTEGQNGVFIGVAIKQDPYTLAQLREIYGIIAPDEKLFYKYPSDSNWKMPDFGNRK